ncbi:ATP-binding protein [Cryptosporangium aurantiacum]|uniref:Regulatory protein, luxR family n=1 Tax=Cryptosporangium aurantiacum TaxID=134849 RepID=A0A1M7KX31_9ACTN|nr:AAA family ATPase [Cryptosporangium aurantiacum]SHM70079.1 regulatory protein, luxR family [Cryptosporangium aurantiacum]
MISVRPFPPVGRDRELDLIRRALTDTANGAGGCLVLSGPPGIGKSHLLRAAVRIARDRSMTVAPRRAFELDRAVPLITLASALRECDPPTDAFAWLPDESGHTYGTLERLRATLEARAAEQPLVVAIDDAHWTDEVSALAIRQLVPALTSSAVRWLFARRPQPADTPGQQVLDWLIREGAEELPLGGLTDAAVGELCAQVLGAEVDSTVTALAGSLGGIPLPVAQLMTSLRVTDQVVVTDGVASVVGTALPSSFVAMIRQVLDQLPVEARRMVQAASVFDRPFGVDEVARLVGVRAADVVPLVEQATVAAILVDEGRALTFVHERIRAAVYNTIGESIAVVLHREAAAIARADGRPPMEVAGHLVQGGADGNREAVELLHTAARDVADVAPSTAADLILRALAVLGEHGSGRNPLVAEAVRLLAAAGRLPEAHALGRTALRAGLDRETEALLLLGLAEAFKHAGKNQTAVDYAEQGLAHATGSDALAARLYAIRAHALFYSDDLDGADRSGELADAIGRACGEYGASVFGRTARSLVAQAVGDLNEAYGHAMEATETADRIGGEALQRHPRIWLASAYTGLDRFDDAARALERGRQESVQLGTGWSAPLWHYYGAALLTARGQLDEAAAEADAGVAVAAQLGSHQLAVPLLAMLTRLAVVRDELTAAADYLRRMHELMDTGITAAPEDVDWAEGVFAHATAGAEPALRRLTGIFDALPTRPMLIGQDPGNATTLLRIALDGGDSARAKVVVRAADGLARRNPGLPALAGAAAHTDGLLRRDLTTLRAAIGHYRRTPRHLVLATALEDAAALTGDARQAREWRREAHALATAGGAHRARRRLEEALGGPATPGRAPESPLDRLSPAERRVALLVAEGLTNHQVAQRLHLSPHTVDSHLRKIFAKLEIQGRVALAAQVNRAANNPG